MPDQTQRASVDYQKLKDTILDVQWFLLRNLNDQNSAAVAQIANELSVVHQDAQAHLLPPGQ